MQNKTYNQEAEILRNLPITYNSQHIKHESTIELFTTRRQS